jgi:hypothetical protein
MIGNRARVPKVIEGCKELCNLRKVHEIMRNLCICTASNPTVSVKEHDESCQRSTRRSLHSMKLHKHGKYATKQYETECIAQNDSCYTLCTSRLVQDLVSYQKRFRATSWHCWPTRLYESLFDRRRKTAGSNVYRSRSLTLRKPVRQSMVRGRGPTKCPQTIVA